MQGPAVTPDNVARRYLAFDADPGGFNNILMQFEIMVVLAWLTGRALIIPPPRPFYLLGSEPRSLLDFFDLEALRKHLNIVTSEDFPPNRKAHQTFHEHMRERGHSPGWNAVEDALIYPPGALTDRLELITRLHGRRPVGITGIADTCEVLYFPTTHEHRMFGVFEAFFLFADREMERRARALVRDAVRYRPEVLQLAERAVAAAPLGGESYSAMHVRRGDFQYAKTRVSAGEILHHTQNLISPDETLYLATDETNREFLRPFQERFQLVQFGDLAPEVIAETPVQWIGIVEALICAAAPGRFVGTRLSTFSARIATVRGHLSCGSGKHAGIDTAIYYTQPPLWGASPGQLQPYGPPRCKHQDEFGETATPWWRSIIREPIWGRAYQAAWADTGDTTIIPSSG